MAGFDLGRLLEGVDLGGVFGSDTIRVIGTDLIRPNAVNFYAMSDLQELAASIELVGLLQPVTVKPAEDGYVLIDGWEEN